jgi:hypothetical protein
MSKKSLTRSLVCPHYESWILSVLSLFFASYGFAQQTPDWMFALEGTYIGRLEMEVGLESLLTYDVRMDGLRNGKEDGFMLQISKEQDEAISESAQMWLWDHENSVVEVTVLENNQPTISEWFVTQSGLSTSLTRGAAEGQRAVIERWRLERLPGQLRWDKYVNFGDGDWRFRWRYVLDEAID